jgi:hypothetical protein
MRYLPAGDDSQSKRQRNSMSESPEIYVLSPPAKKAKTSMTNEHTENPSSLASRSLPVIPKRSFKNLSIDETVLQGPPNQAKQCDTFETSGVVTQQSTTEKLRNLSIESQNSKKKIGSVISG